MATLLLAAGCGSKSSSPSADGSADAAGDAAGGAGGTGGTGGAGGSADAGGTGGSADAGACRDASASTTNWTNRTPCPLPAAWPPAAIAPAMVYDSTRHKVLVYDNDSLREWDGAAGTWTDRTPSPKPAAWPAARPSIRLAYDADRKRVVLFSGEAAGAANAELWELDPAAVTWAQAPKAATWPPVRRVHALAYDADRKRTVLFGGQSETSFYRDLWEWDGAAWTNLTPAPLPDAWPAVLPDDPQLVYDSDRKVTIMMRGAEIWEFDPGMKTLVDHSPAAVVPTNGWIGIYGQVAYDPFRKRVVAFALQTATYSSRAWEWDAAKDTWQNVTPPSPGPDDYPLFRWNVGLCADTARGTVVLFGGATQTSTSPELWEWKGTAP